MGIQFRGGAYAGLIADLGSIHSTMERKKEKKDVGQQKEFTGPGN